MVDLVKTDNVTVVRRLDIGKFPERERIEMVRWEYPKPFESMIFLKGLYDRGAVSGEKAILLEKSKLLTRMMDQERVKEVNGKFYLN